MIGIKEFFDDREDVLGLNVDFSGSHNSLFLFCQGFSINMPSRFLCHTDHFPEINATKGRFSAKNERTFGR